MRSKNVFLEFDSVNGVDEVHGTKLQFCKGKMQRLLTCYASVIEYNTQHVKEKSVPS